MMLMALLLFHSVSLKTYPVATYIPDRYDEGYGISFKGIDFADDNGFRLLLLV
jgi:single-stranded-DNA-specific exonuclease